jgi:hypothetical protein
MPAFVPDGPDVPERLLQAHEEGRVVFFCGAGISYPAGLPGFQDLVRLVYEEIGETCDEVERMSYRQHRYDETFDLLERRLKDRNKDQLFVRKAVAKILEPNVRRKGAQDTHKAILDLSRDGKGVTRLVTTNFDRIFEHVIRQQKRKIQSFLAPLLPIPKITKWDGVVYLHGGLLSKTPTATELNRIVLSSGDFGLAYLSERWASRFVSELLKNFIVCFVGYSIEDPVLRYMMDALAADELLGEDKIESFAFASFKGDNRKSMEQKWKAKGVAPLLFDEEAGGARFRVLHQTLQEWARVYTTGIHGKRTIVSTHAGFPPKILSRSDYVVGRMLWALTDPKAAKHFADLDPVPPLDWLEPLDELLFDASDLNRFGVKEKQEDDDKRTFAMLRRPSPSTLSPWMELVTDGSRWTSWDTVMHELARWLVRHLGNPKLILWIASRGGRLSPRFWQLIESRLTGLKKLEITGDITKLDEIRKNNPDGIPSPAIRKLWELILANRIKKSRDLNFYGWFSRLAVNGWTLGLKSELRDLLRPCVALAKPYQGLVSFGALEDSNSINSLVRWEVLLATDHAIAAVRDNKAEPNWQNGLHQFLDVFQSLLIEALEIMTDLGQSAKRRHVTAFELPSIEDHSQNLGHHDWTLLVLLTRDAWLAVSKIDPKKASEIAREWWSSEYPLFKRLALFAASQEGIVDDVQIVEWLISEDGRWLWDIEIKRETLRLLTVMSQHWSSSSSNRRIGAQSQLERAILRGPTRDNASSDASEDDFMMSRDSAVWLRLAKLSAGGYKLGRSAANKLAKLQRDNPTWRIANDGRDELPFWVEVGTREPDLLTTPWKPRELLKWLENHAAPDWHQNDDWRDRCRTHFRSVSCVLKYSYKQNQWYPDRLQAALYVWAEDKELLKRSWFWMAAFVLALTDDQKKDVLDGLSWWIRAGSSVFDGNDECFYSLASDLVRLSAQNLKNSNRDIMLEAINHPVGQATEAMLKWWSRLVAKGNSRLDGEAHSFLTSICLSAVDSRRMGRVILAQYIGWIYRVDPDWTKAHLVPHFDWNVSREEACACWTGFLYSPRHIPALLSVLKQPFLKTMQQKDDLPADCRESFARFFTFVALEPAGVFTQQELRAGFASFDLVDLNQAARALRDVMEGAGEKAETLWRDSIRPLIQKIWPKSADKRSEQIAGSFAEICIYANEDFQEAISELTPYLQEILWSSTLLDKLMERDLHRRFPRNALDLIVRVANTSRIYRSDSLKLFLDQTSEKEPGVKRLKIFKELTEMLDE